MLRYGVNGYAEVQCQRGCRGMVSTGMLRYGVNVCARVQVNVCAGVCVNVCAEVRCQHAC